VLVKIPTSNSLAVLKDKNGYLATREVKSMGSEGIKHGSVIVFADLGEENMVLEVPKVEDNEECDEVDSGTTNSNGQPLFPLFPIDDCVQIDIAMFVVVGDDDRSGVVERESGEYEEQDESEISVDEEDKLKGLSKSLLGPL
ncbi:hypothetical protein U1Q18_032612, partial [Sarracenia purpurea var. burkii]